MLIRAWIRVCRAACFCLKRSEKEVLGPWSQCELHRAPELPKRQKCADMEGLGVTFLNGTLDAFLKIAASILF
jgi:hypothetical protein